jgi:hypothetical protein
MKNLSLLFVSFLLFQLTIFSQAPDTVWTRTFGGIQPDGGRSVIQTTDGNYVITGNTRSFGAGLSDVGLMKVDPNGNLLWIKTFGGALEDEGYSVIQTADGNYVITGYTYSFGAGGSDVGLMKVDPNGNLIWLKSLGGPTTDSGNEVIQTTDGSLIIVGHTYIEDPPNSRYNVLLIKTDANGNQLWSKSYGSGLFYTYGFSVIQTPDGGFAIAGSLISATVLSNVFFIKTDSNGNEIYHTEFGGNGSDDGVSMVLTSDGNFIIAGYTDSFGAGSYDIALMKVNPNGNLLWIKTFGGTEEDVGRSIIQTADGNYVITGTTNSFNALQTDIGLMKVDTNGNLLWIKIIGGNNTEVGWDVKQIAGGGYIITGTTNSFGAGNYDVYLLKFHPDVADVEDEFVVSNFFLDQNYPNPFNPGTIIKYQVPELSFVTIKVYDVLGNEVATLVNEEKPAGEYEVEFRVNSDAGQNLSSGIYFYQLKADSFIETKKMLLIK